MGGGGGGGGGGGETYTGFRNNKARLCSLHAFIASNVKTGLSANAVLLQEHNLLNISLDVCGEDGIVQHSRKAAACLWNLLRPITSLSPCPIWIQVSRTH